MALGARVALRRPAQNRLKIGVRREGTVSNNILETQRLPRTDGGDPASICSVARRGGISQSVSTFNSLSTFKNTTEL